MFDLNNFDGAVIRFIIIFSIIVIFFLYKVVKNIIQDKDNIDNHSSSKELMLYSSNQNEDKKTNHKQNIYNKYYFNVYVKQPYNKNGKTNTKAGYKNQKTHKQSDDNFINVEVIV